MSDDDLLKTKEAYQGGDFDEFSLLPAGEYKVKVESVDGEMRNFDNYTGPQAVLKMRTDTNKIIFDRINLPHAQEKDGNRKRRAAILSKLGLISKGETNELDFDWKRLEGMEFFVTVEHRKGEDKQGNPRTFANVPFAGYRAIGSEPAKGAAASGGGSSVVPTPEQAPTTPAPTAPAPAGAPASGGSDFDDI